MTRSKRVERGSGKLCKGCAIGIASMVLLFGPAWAGGNAQTTGGNDAAFEDGDLGLDSIGKLKPASREEAQPAVLHDTINKSKPQHGPAWANSGSVSGGDAYFQGGDLGLDFIGKLKPVSREEAEPAALRDTINKSKPQHGPAWANGGSMGGGDAYFQGGDLGLDFIGKLKPVSREEAQPAALHDTINKSKPGHGLALIERQNGKDRTYRVSYGHLFAPIVESIQQQQAIKQEGQQNADCIIT
jgi:hypothetical protein